MALTFSAIADFSACYKAGRKMPKGVPEGIVVHSTGANNPTLKRYVNAPDICGTNPSKNYFGGPGSNDVTPHGVIGKDKNGAVKGAQILPYNICCWGCGSGTKGSYNYNPAYIQFEIAEDGLTDITYFNNAFELMAQICADLMKTYPSIKLENIVSHKEACARGYASNHGDPENWMSKFGKNMNWFRDKVKGYLGTTSSSSSTSNTTSNTTSTSTTKLTYAKLSDVLGSTAVSISAIFREYCDPGKPWGAGWHNGIDIAAGAGTPIKAIADGTVINADTESKKNDGFGNRVLIKHPDGKTSLYAHMLTTPSVKVGQTVKKGDVIGKVGSTGHSTGNHLHLTIVDNWDKNPDMYYTGDLLDPIKVCGLGTMKFSSNCGNTIRNKSGNKESLGDLNKYYGGTSSGTTTTVTVTQTNNSPASNFKVGDIVEFTGSTHYTSSTGTRGTAAKPGLAKITQLAPGTAHPIHLVNVAGKGSTVYGWVNESDIHTDLKVGDNVKFTGVMHYASSTATSGTSCKPGTAKITKIVEGAAHPIHLQNVSGGGSTVYGWVDKKDVSK